MEHKETDFETKKELIEELKNLDEYQYRQIRYFVTLKETNIFLKTMGDQVTKIYPYEEDGYIVEYVEREFITPKERGEIYIQRLREMDNNDVA